MNFLLLPLTFLSAAFMQQSLMPDWMQSVAEVNPVNWAVQAGREASLGGTDWSMVAGRIGLLVALLAVCSVFATRAFRSYQRSV
jgi:ABC-2 type transport system permease protein